jgi:hypothetical protein
MSLIPSTVQKKQKREGGACQVLGKKLTEPAEGCEALGRLGAW